MRGLSVGVVLGAVLFATSQLNGAASGTMTCVGAYSGTFVALNTGCT